MYNINTSGIVIIRTEFIGNNFYNGAIGIGYGTFNKMNNSIVIDPIHNVKFGDIIAINGNLYDQNGNIIANASFNITIAGFTYTILTNGLGKFSYNYNVNTTGILDVIIEFFGNYNYMASSNSTSFM
ncbi:hypothetical protein ALNOE001_15580 [Candidatus Methanobinarius endosymbioticus]|uniref:Bacterial Ig-like domain-containing protein n=1 Tax=Candidatus Methanobinarius endosymbioticus TaxID=2006182 RepID=A0A366MAG9_9EURY|nr:hypothetical protein ALNOE001_15580 [Candidatus Methanobinarius endosymbioticus]